MITASQRFPQDEVLLFKVLDKYGHDQLVGFGEEGLSKFEMSIASFAELVDQECVVPVLWSGETVKVAVDPVGKIVTLVIAHYMDWPRWLQDCLSFEIREPVRLGVFIDCTSAQLEDESQLLDMLQSVKD